MITVRRWDATKNRSVAIDPATLTTELASLQSAEVLWIDLEAATPEEETLIFETFLPVHFLTLEDITRPRRELESPTHLPKAEEFPEYLFVIANPLKEKPLGDGVLQRPEVTQLSAVLTHTTLITHHYQPLDSVQTVLRVLERNGHQMARGPDYIFHLVLDAVVDEFAVALDQIDDVLDEFEVEVFAHPQHSQLSGLLRIKRDVTIFRKLLVYQREVVARLARGEFELIDEREEAYYRNVYDHLIRFSELAETSRDKVSDLMQAHLGAISNRLNATMKVLTTVSTLILPMGLVAGIYGMNFEDQPEYHWSFGYAWALGLMAFLGIGSYTLFRWRGWV